MTASLYKTQLGADYKPEERKRPRTHETQWLNGTPITTCGRFRAKVNTRIRKVDCKMCLRIIRMRILEKKERSK